MISIPNNMKKQEIELLIKKQININFLNMKVITNLKNRNKRLDRLWITNNKLIHKLQIENNELKKKLTEYETNIKKIYYKSKNISAKLWEEEIKVIKKGEQK